LTHAISKGKRYRGGEPREDGAGAGRRSAFRPEKQRVRCAEYRCVRADTHAQRGNYDRGERPGRAPAFARVTDVLPENPALACVRLHYATSEVDVSSTTRPSEQVDSAVGMARVPGVVGYDANRRPLRW